MQSQNSLTLHWHSFSEWGNDNVAFSFAYNGCHYIQYVYPLPDHLVIIWLKGQNIVEAPLTLIFMMGKSRYHTCFCMKWQPIHRIWISTTNQHLDNHDAMPKIVDAPLPHMSRMQQWPCRVLLWIWLQPIYRLCLTTTKSLYNYHVYKTNNCWCLVDAHLNPLPSHYLLPSIIVWRIMCTHSLPCCQIGTQPCGKAEPSNILAQVALILPKLMYLAEWFNSPAIHLFMNKYSHATAQYSAAKFL